MTEKPLFSREDAQHIEQQARDLVGKKVKVTVGASGLMVTAHYVPPFGQKARDLLAKVLLICFSALAVHLTFQTTVLAAPAAFVSPYVYSLASLANLPTPESLMALVVSIVVGLGFVGLLMVLVFGVFDYRRCLSGRTLRVVFTPGEIIVPKLFGRAERYPRDTVTAIEQRPHEGGKDEEYRENFRLRKHGSSLVGSYYRKSFHIALRLDGYGRADLANVYGQQQAEAIHNALNFGSDVMQRLSRSPKLPSSPASGKSYEQRPGV
ncbi:MAG: hypothetical protein ACR2RE_08860 [Geminicoccaceae bacterium]